MALPESIDMEHNRGEFGFRLRLKVVIIEARDVTRFCYVRGMGIFVIRNVPSTGQGVLRTPSRKSWAQPTLHISGEEP